MQPKRNLNHDPLSRQAAPLPRGPQYSTRIPASEPGPYEDATDPASRFRRPTLTRNVLYYGGAGILAAAATAGVVLAARRLLDDDKEAGPDNHRPRGQALAPRFADLDEVEREEIRRRAREQARADQNRAARLRAKAARERVAPRRNIARDITETADNLSGSIHGVIGALSSALAGFQQVAQQAGGIMREFSAAADTVRGLVDRPADRSSDRSGPRREDRPAGPAFRDDAAAPERTAPERTVRIDEADRQEHGRMHRL